MSMDYDELYDDWAYGEAMAQLAMEREDELRERLYDDYREEAIEEFTYDLLRSYYNDNRLLAKPAFQALAEAKALKETNATAGFLFSAIAMEVGLKETLLKPIVFGLVHSTSAASLITFLVISHRSMDSYRKLLLEILREHGGVDLDTYKRPGSNKPIWQEIKEIQKIRNLVLHRAETASDEQAALAIGVASTIVQELFPAVVTKLGLHLHDGFKICNDLECKQ